MTNQVAITMLKNLEQSLDDYCELNDEGKEAFHMAITALELFGISEQLPSVHPELSNNSKELENKNGELISRQQAIDALDKRFDSVPMEQTTEILMLRKDLRELPSAQPRTGKWIDTNPDKYLDPRMTCDQCGNTETLHKANFCPNCGCRMEEGDAE